jgi:hypothetical protein
MTNLEDRLLKAGIDPDEFAEIVWRRLEARVEAMVAKRAMLLMDALAKATANYSEGMTAISEAQK